MLKRVFAVSVFIFGLSDMAHSGVWVPAGDQVLRHHLQILADFGVIKTPINSWPLNWSNIKRDLDSVNQRKLPKAASLSAQYVGFEVARYTDAFVAEIGNTVASSPNVYRGFNEEIGDDSEVFVRIEGMVGAFAVNLEGAYVADAGDGDEKRYDGSYAAALLGNWAVGVGAVDRWWGPGWQDSLSISTNARPQDGFFLRRNYSDPIDFPVLAWLGDWQLELFANQLERDNNLNQGDLYGSRLTLRPLRHMEFGVSNLWLTDELTEDQTFSSFDVKLSFTTGNFTHGLYGQFGDASDIQEENFLAGYELGLALEKSSHRVIFEYSDSHLMSYQEWPGASNFSQLAHDILYSVAADNDLYRGGRDEFSEACTTQTCTEGGLYGYGYSHRGRHLGAASYTNYEGLTVMGQHYFGEGWEVDWKFIDAEYSDAGRQTGEEQALLQQTYAHIGLGRSLSEQLKGRVSVYYLDVPIPIFDDEADSGASLSLIYRY